MEKLIRLNKFIAQNGTVSRRKADRLIETGKVSVNGKVIHDFGVKVRPSDKVIVNGKELSSSTEKIYIMFNKPKATVSTMSDPEMRESLADYFADLPVRVYPVGRLDWDSEGLIIMTNDGNFANKIMHPRLEIPKTYLVKVEGKPAAEDIKKLLDGVSIPGGKVRAKMISKIQRPTKTNHSWYKIVITEGKNRQIRHMFSNIGLDALKIQRVGIGMLFLGSLEKGDYKFLGPKELKKVFATEPLPEKKTPRHKSFKRYSSSGAKG